MSSNIIARRDQVAVETEHFASHLPCGLTWAAFDAVVARCITIASIEQWWTGTGGFTVWPQDCERWLIQHLDRPLDEAAFASAKCCIPTGFRRLLLQQRVHAPASHPHHLPPVSPLAPYPMDSGLVARCFPGPWAARPAPPAIGWDAFKAEVIDAINTLTMNSLLEDPMGHAPSYAALVECLIGRGWNGHDLDALLPVTLSRYWLEDHGAIRNGYPGWHPALVLHAACATHDQQQTSEVTGLNG